MDTAPAGAPEARAPNGMAVVPNSTPRRYGEGESAVDALRGVSLGIPRGQFTSVMGQSGSGKSTLMHILAGLDVPTSGSATIGGRNIADMDDGELTLLRREHIGFSRCARGGAASARR